MSEIEFLSEIGAPQKYGLLYVNVFDEANPVQTPLDPVAAAEQAEALAERGSPLAQLVLGHKLLSGHGVAQDQLAAYRWFCRAAESGRADALNMVGRCHQRGWGVPIDTAKAAQWFRMAADKSHAWAKFNLGELMLAGDGVPRDPESALALFVRSARRGNAKAMNMIGQYRERGWRGHPKLASALRWYRRAAHRGCFRGQYNFARILAAAGETGAAARWLEIAFTTAPPEFCRDVGEELRHHPDTRIRDAGAMALARAVDAST